MGEIPRESEGEQPIPEQEQGEVAPETRESINLRAMKRENELLEFQQKTYKEFGGIQEFNKILERAARKNEKNQGKPENKQKPFSEEEATARKVHWGIVLKYSEIHKEQKDALKKIGIEPDEPKGDTDDTEGRLAKI